MKALKVILAFLKLKLAISRNHLLRIVVGSSGVFEKGWIPTDVSTLNLLKPKKWRLFLKENSIDIILAEHVWEHLTVEEGMQAASTCYTFLKKGGWVRAAVPDGFHPRQEYIEYVKPGGTGAGADDHKVLYNYKTFAKAFEQAGFTVQLLEYFDEKGNFCFKEWNKDDGMIHRSTRFDERNNIDPHKYTSIVLDARK